MVASLYDIVVVGDFRFPGGTSTAIASELKAQAKAGYRTGLIQVSCPLLRYPHAMHGEIRALLDAGRVEQLDPEAQHEARLVVAHHPALFIFPPRRALAISAPTRILVVNHPPATARGVSYYDVTAVDANAAELLGGEVLWAPVGPAVRAQLDGGRNGDGLRRPSMLAEDWCNVIDADEWHCERRGPRGNRPVIGRHSGPQREKWPATREELLEAYPDDPAIEVRILGADSFLEELAGPFPPNWTVLPFDGETPAEFLGSLDFFVYFHHPDWVEAFGRTVLEALASGAVAILPKSLRQTFGDAALYAEPEEVASLAKRLHGDAAQWRRQSERGRQVVRSRFSLAHHSTRIAAIVGEPHRREIAVARPRPVAPVLFVASNGIGMGHLTRQLAIARRCPVSIRPTFATLSQGMAVIREFGFPAEYIPYHSYLDCDAGAWNDFLHQELNEMLAFHDPRVVVFDGNVPYGGLLRTIADHPERWFVWSRRAMWRAGLGAEHIAREKHFDLVLEPRQLAAAFDRGLTLSHRGKTQLVDPVYLYDGNEMLPRAEARAALGLDPDRLCALIHLGAGNNFGADVGRARLVDGLAAVPGVQIAVAEWLIANEETWSPEGAINLRRYPLAPYLKAFDFAIGAAGYNSFHEAILAGLPTLFVPNEHPMMDDQLARASYAERHGLGLCLRARDVYRADAALAILLDADRRAAMRAACERIEFANGAADAARLISELAFARRADRRF